MLQWWNCLIFWVKAGNPKRTNSKNVRKYEEFVFFTHLRRNRSCATIWGVNYNLTRVLLMLLKTKIAINSAFLKRRLQPSLSAFPFQSTYSNKISVSARSLIIQLKKNADPLQFTYLIKTESFRRDLIERLTTWTTFRKQTVEFRRQSRCR